MNTNPGRANPFAEVDLLPNFEPKPKASKPIASDQVEKIASANGFPSRQPVAVPNQKRAVRRYKTGRNQQINIKATADVIARLYKLADEKRIPLGELLEQALEALEGREAIRE